MANLRLYHTFLTLSAPRVFSGGASIFAGANVVVVAEFAAQVAAE